MYMGCRIAGACGVLLPFKGTDANAFWNSCLVLLLETQGVDSFSQSVVLVLGFRNPKP